MRGCACRGTAGFAHVCLAEQAKILFERPWRVGVRKWNERWARCTCGLCEHVPRRRSARSGGRAGRRGGRRRTGSALAIEVLGNGLFSSDNEAALSVQLAELAMKRRLGSREENALSRRTILQTPWRDASKSPRTAEVYSTFETLWRKRENLISANNYASTLVTLEQHKKLSVLRKTMPVARRVLGEGNDLTLRLRWNYAKGLYKGAAARLRPPRGRSRSRTRRTARRAR